MSFDINTNIASLQAQNYLRITSNFQSKTINEVTSGLRIVNSGDDAAGLAIANTDRSNEAVLTQGVQNANDALSQLQTADGGISNISQLLDRARTLATQSASGAFTGDRTVLNSEFQSVITEISRQAQAIGLNSGGTFAKNLNVFIGGGQSSNGITATANGSINLDLSQSTVDPSSLGLSGVQASGAAGTDIGPNSATSLSNILSNATNTSSTQTPGTTTFYLKGPGFDGIGVTVNVNTANLGGTPDLVTAINAAISGAANGGTQQATALRNANVVAGTTTDANGGQQLTFTSSTTAFQVQAGDRVSNALLGNFEQNATITGTDANATLDTSGGAANRTLTLAVDGASPISVVVTNSAATSKAQIVKDLNNDTGAGHFASVATAHLVGDQIVIKSNSNNANSSIAITSNAFATNLGLSSTTATAATASTGADLSTYVTAAANTAAGGSTFGATGAGNITFRFQGAGESGPTDLTIAVTAGETVTQAITALNTAVSGNANLKAAGISLSTSTATDALTFTSSKGEQFSVQVTGDVQNKLGFGSFVTGANSAVDYSTLTGSSDYNSATAVGTNTYQISLNGGASNTHAIAVDLAGGDATAAAVTSTDSSAAALGVTANNNILNLAINGTSFTVTLNAGGSVTKSDIANQINAVIAAQGTATVNSNNQIVVTSNTKGAGGTVEIQNGTANTLLGFAAAGPVAGTSRSGASIAQALNTAFAADSTLQAAGLVADYNVTTPNRITVKSATGNGTFFRVDSLGSTASAAVEAATQQGTLASAATTGAGSTTTATIVAATNDDFNIAINGGATHDIFLASGGGAQNLSQIAAELNANPLLAGATASVDATGHLLITSTATGVGPGSRIVLTAGTHDALGALGLTANTYNGTASAAGFNITGANDQVSVSVDGGTAQVITLTHGANQTAANIRDDLNTYFTANSIGATASVDNGHLKVVSNSTGTGSSILFNAHAASVYATIGITAGTTYVGNAAQTGFGVAGASFTGNVSSSAPAVATQVDAGGASQTAALNFTPVLYGSDDQTVTVTAPDNGGVQQSTSVTLRNDSTGRNARSIDEALEAINTALQQTNNPTLQQIVAVKDDSSGTEQIRFISSLNSFQVSIGTTGQGTGVGSQGTTAASARSAGGSTADINSISSATAAVSALATAVSKLGSAQAVVGRGENQFNYAINLAQSQLTNLSAAEARIRDADLAAESADLTKSQIQLQAGIAALAQANSAPQQVLKLLQ